MIYSFTKDIDLICLIELFNSVGWQSISITTLQKAIQNSIPISLWDGRILVGFVRVISDGVTLSSIWDLAVRPKYQRQGLGTFLINLAMQQCRTPFVFTLADNSAVNFYTGLGFTGNSPNCTPLFLNCNEL